ncbi:MAG: TetR/AcrR family transcriptional regulator [Chloroflexi bacterium]|nr:TetR/AcrR family transcriptional regulator [Chloroflexota bacterium]
MVRELSNEKRATFLRSALKLFVARGVQHTSTSEIAKEAGTAAGTLFLYFPTKQALIDELILKIGKEQSDYINTLLVSPLPVRETFFTIWDGTLRWFMENMDAYQYVQQVRDSGMVSAAAVQESGKFFGYYYAAIQKGHDENRIKPYSIDLIGSILYQDLVAIMNLMRIQPDPAKREEIMQQGFAIYWDGIKL